MPAPKPFWINPTQLHAMSPVGSFLRGYLMSCKDRPERYVIERDVVHHHNGRAFRLTHDLHRRDMQTKSDELPRYFVAANPPKSGNPRGNFGEVGGYLGSLHPILEDGVLFVPGSQRVFKNTICMSTKEEYVIEQEKDVLNENKLSDRAKKLYPKGMFTAENEYGPSGIYSSMRRAKGVTLNTWLEAEARRQKNQFNPQRLVNVSLALMQALHLQVSRHRVVHCDIKPENIFIYEGCENQFSITFIDFGFATDNFNDNLLPQGTPSYMPPEYPRMARRKHDLKFDIYSMGRVLGQVWGCQDDGWMANTINADDNQNKVEALAESLLSRYVDADGNGNQDSPLNTSVKKIIKSALALDPDQRASLDDLYNDLLSELMIEDESLRNVHRLGFNTRQELESTNSEESFFEVFCGALSQFDDQPEAILHFIQGLGWDALRFSRRDGHQIETKTELILLVEGVFKKRKRALGVLSKAKRQIEMHEEICKKNLEYYSHLKSYVAINEAFIRLRKKCERLSNRIEDRGFSPDLDEVLYRSERFCHEYLSLAELHDLIHFKVRKKSGGHWDFIREAEEFEQEASDALKEKFFTMFLAENNDFDDPVKHLVINIICNKAMSFFEKRYKLILLLAKGKLQREYVELCITEMQSPVYSMEPYYVLISMLERMNNHDVETQFLKSLADALRSYLAETSDDRNLNLLYRAASAKRLEVVHQIQALFVNDPSQKAMLSGLKNIVLSMKTGPLARSLLKQKLIAVINQYEDRKDIMAKKPRIIDVTKLSVEDMKLVSQFLKKHKEKDVMVLAGEVYTHHLHQFQFKNDMIYLGEEQNGDNTLPPRFSVIKGLLGDQTEGLEHVYDVCGHLNLTQGDACFYTEMPHAEVLRVIGPDVNLPEREMKAEFAARYSRINEVYEDKRDQADLRIPAIRAKYSAKLEDVPRGLYVLQAGTTLGQFLETKGQSLTVIDRMRLMNGLLDAYRRQVSSRQKLLTYLDLDSILIAENENGDYQFDLIGHGAHPFITEQLNTSVVGKPHFMHPSAVRARMPDERGDIIEDAQANFSYATDAWSVGRILCEVWDERREIKNAFTQAYHDQYHDRYIQAFETKALAKIESKVASRGFFARAFHRIKSIFVKPSIYATNKDKIHSLLNNEELISIQKEVSVDLEAHLSYELALAMPDKLTNFIKGANAPDQIKDVLSHLLSNLHDATRVLFHETFQLKSVSQELDDPELLAALEKVKSKCNELSLKASLFLNNEQALHAKPSIWGDYKSFCDELNSVVKANVSATTVNYLLEKWKAIHALIQMELDGARIFNVDNITQGSTPAKMLFECLQAQVAHGVTWFPKGHVFLDKQGAAYRLSHALNVRQKGGVIHYDVLEPLSLKESKEHSNVYSVVGVLKPGVNDSLMFARRINKAQASRRLVKQNVESNVAQAHQDIGGEFFIQQNTMNHLFKPKNKQESSFNQRRVPGSMYSRQIDVDARLSNEGNAKLNRFLSIVRAFYIQVYRNNIQYLDVKPDNLMYYPMPNGEEIFTVIDFEPGRWNDYGCPPVNSKGELSDQQEASRAIERQPLFGLGVILAQLYCGLEYKKINLHSRNDLATLEADVNDHAIPEKIKGLIKDLLSPNDKVEIFSVEGLMTKVHECLLNDEAYQNAYLIGCQMRQELIEEDSREAFFANIQEQCSIMTTKGQIQAFIRGLGFVSLLKDIANIESLDQLVAKMEAIFNAKAEVAFAWEAKRDALKILVDARAIDDTLMTEAQTQSLTFAYEEAMAKCVKIHAHYDHNHDLDALEGAHARLLGLSMNEFNRVHSRSLSLTKTLMPRAQAILLQHQVQADNAVDPIKAACAEALKSYTQKKGALSKRRSQDIAGLKHLIEHGQGEALQTAVKAYVKNTLAGGIFGKRSLLKGELAASLSRAIKLPVGRA